MKNIIDVLLRDRNDETQTARVLRIIYISGLDTSNLKNARGPRFLLRSQMPMCQILVDYNFENCRGALH